MMRMACVVALAFVENGEERLHCMAFGRDGDNKRGAWGRSFDTTFHE
jgi:hypothetical protein